MKIENRNKYLVGNVKNFTDTKGYFIGRFMGERGQPLLETDEVEIAWKKLSPIVSEDPEHYHKGGVEVTIVISGGFKLLIENKEIEVNKGDFVLIYPETKAKTLFIQPDTELIVIKAPSLQNDKYFD